MTAAKKNRSASFARSSKTRRPNGLNDIIDELTGRNVISYQSQIMFSLDRVVEIFVFDDEASSESIKAIAQGQLRAEPIGEVANEDVGLDELACQAA